MLVKCTEKKPMSCKRLTMGKFIYQNKISRFATVLVFHLSTALITSIPHDTFYIERKVCFEMEFDSKIENLKIHT